ncbi:MAG: hypothetical protein AAFO07_19940 [Bacteroidota bacterium]
MRILFFSVISLILFVSCSSQKKPKYTIDNNLVSEVVEIPSLNMNFQPPLGWKELPIPNADQYNQALSAVTPYPISVRKLFMNQENQNLVLISDISRLKKELHDQMLEEYNSMLNIGNQWNTIEKDFFEQNDLIVDEFILQSNLLVSYKVLYPYDGDPKFQLDFFLQKGSYDENLKKTIEASIASIQR